MDFLKWLWGVEILRILMIYLWLHGHEGYPFVFHQPIFKKVALAGLNSLQHKGYQILVKHWIFEEPFHKKGQLLVILVPGMSQPSGSVIFLMKWGCWGHWGHWGCWGCWGRWGCRGSKAWKITTGDFRVIQVLEFNLCPSSSRKLKTFFKYHNFFIMEKWLLSEEF